DHVDDAWHRRARRAFDVPDATPRGRVPRGAHRATRRHPTRRSSVTSSMIAARRTRYGGAERARRVASLCARMPASVPIAASPAAGGHPLAARARALVGKRRFRLGVALSLLVLGLGAAGVAAFALWP